MSLSTFWTRRPVLLALAAAPALSGGLARAAQPRRIGYIGNVPSTSEPLLAAFRNVLRRLGYADSDIEIVALYPEGHFDRLPDLAAELVRLAPDVIVASPPQAVKALQRATATIPIVMTSVGDPVGLGLVGSLGHPGGNITGLSTLSEDMAGKWVELLKTAEPSIRRIGFLLNPTNPAYSVVWPGALRTAQSLEIALLSFDARAPEALDSTFAEMARSQIDALICWGDPMLIQERGKVIGFAGAHRLPAVYQFREFVADGGLLSFGPELTDLFRRAAGYVDKILKGARPGDLPVEQPVRFQLVINLKTARGLGLTLSPLLLARADEVVE